jgi:hypothetical protein
VIICGEPDDPELLRLLEVTGVSAADVLGFYTIRMIPQWIREKIIRDAGDGRIDRLLEDELRRNREILGLGGDVIPTVEDLRRWYQSMNGKPLDPRFKLEEVGPLVDGPFRTNAVGAEISKGRAAYLHALVIDRLNAGERVLVVFGASHLMIHQPALDAALGAPCYYGATLFKAPSLCK